jgi:muconate cycloisomerase
MAKGAIDIACWDVLGKSLGKPIHSLLGGALRTRIPLLYPFGDQPASADRKMLQNLVAKGYRTFMFKAGSSGDMANVRRQVERIRAADRDFTGLHICVDANQGWNAPGTIAFARAILASPSTRAGRNTQLSFVEQPLPKNASSADRRRIFNALCVCGDNERGGVPVGEPETSPGLEQCKGCATGRRRGCQCPKVLLSADEAITSLSDAKRALEEGVYRVFSIKVSKNGGITRTFKIARSAEVCGVQW